MTQNMTYKIKLIQNSFWRFKIVGSTTNKDVAFEEANVVSTIRLWPVCSNGYAAFDALVAWFSTLDELSKWMSGSEAFKIGPFISDANVESTIWLLAARLSFWSVDAILDTCVVRFWASNDDLSAKVDDA